MNCILCKESMYKDLTFETLFKKPKKVHRNCTKKIKLERESTVIPTKLNMIEYHAVLSFIPEGFLPEDVWLLYAGNILKKYINNDSWSVLLFSNKEAFELLEIETIILLLKLSQDGLVIISIDKKLLYYLEDVM